MTTALLIIDLQQGMFTARPAPHEGEAVLSRVAGLMDGRHLVLTAPHPSPLSAHSGFVVCRHFSKANAFLEAQGRGAIDWRV